MSSASRPHQRPAGNTITPPTTNKADPIAIGLQQLFASVADEPVPDEFLALLDRIEAAEREQSAGVTAQLPSASTESPT